MHDHYINFCRMNASPDASCPSNGNRMPVGLLISDRELLITHVFDTALQQKRYI